MTKSGGNFIKRKLLLICFFIVAMMMLTTTSATQIDNSTDNHLNDNDQLKVNDKDLVKSEKIDAGVSGKADSVSEGMDVLVKITLNENATGNITVDNKYSSPVKNGNANVTIPDLESGRYNLSVHYSGDDNFLESDTYVVFNVKFNQSLQIIGEDEINYGDINYISIILPDNATGFLIIYNDTSNYTVDVTSSIITIECANLPIGMHGIVVEYSGDDTYEKSRASLFFNVYYDMIVTSNAHYSDDAIVKVSIFEGVYGNLTVTGDDVNLNSSLDDGYAEINLGFLEYGYHNITVCYLGDEKYPKITKNHTIFTGANILIDSEVIYKGFNEITFELPEDASGNLTISISGVGDVVVDVVEGEAYYPLNNLAPKDYSVTITYSGDDKYETETLYTIITVIPKLSIPDEITTGTNEFSILLPEDAGGNFTIGVDGDETSSRIENGTCTIYLENISSGEHVISIKYSGDEKYDEYSDIISADVLKLTCDLNMVFSGELVEGNVGYANIYTASDANGILLVDYNGNSLYTNIVSGHATLNLGVLTKGSKNIVCTFLGDDKYDSTVKTISFNVLAKERIVTGNLYMYYADGSKFKAQVFGSNEKPLGGAVVGFTIKGKTYHVRTNAYGYAYLTINSKSGKYSIITTYKDLKASNIIVVKHILKSKNVKIKNSTKKFTLKAQLKKHIKGKKITFKVNGKKITAKTNKKGVAKATFKKSFIKKLKVGKKYKIKITYKKETITKTLKVKK